MREKKIFITGCGGMLGNAIYSFFSSKYPHILATDKLLSEEWLQYLDVRDTKRVAKMFDEYQPDLVLHLAAETDVEFCETNVDIAKDTNSHAVKSIAKITEEHGATLVYISTAGVFDGLKKSPYTENDQPNPIMVYGRTKYEGELHAVENCSKTFVVRAGWMMGGGRKKEKKFIFKILQQIKAGNKEICAVNDKFGTPTYTYDFAKNLFSLIETKKYGVYHMVCEGKGTRYDVASEILDICEIPDIKLTQVNSDFFKDIYFVKRPPSEMMINVNLSNLGVNHMQPWRDSLRNYIENYFSDYIEIGNLVA